jgi:multidrug efflux pump subunit AcrA (membrane-fusion protein)
VESNKKPMKKSLVWTIVFIIIVLILTFFSKTLYNLNLPSVSCSNATYGSLKRVFTCETVAAAKTEYDLYAPSTQKVLEVPVREGDFVEKGQPLVRLDTSGLENELLQLQLEKQQTTDAKRAFSSKAYQLATEAVDKRIEEKQAEIDGSFITAPADGYVTALTAKAGMTTNTMEPLITVGSMSGGLQVKLNVTQKQAAWFAKDDKLSVYIPILSRTYDAFVVRVKSGEVGGMMVLADISDPSGNIAADQLAEVSFTKMSGVYPLLVPISALHSDGDRDYIFKLQTVQGPLGNEYRIFKTFVRVIDRDDTNAALEAELSPDDRIVTESDKELFGGRVKLTEE